MRYKLLFLSLVLTCNISAQSKMDSYLSEVERLVSHRDMSNPKVSEANVAWHLDHIVKVINAISKSTISSDPQKYTYKLNRQRCFIFTTGIIPRGVAKAPKSVTPPAIILTEDIFMQLQMSRNLLSEINKLANNHYMEHPVFGHLNTRRVKKFLKIHTRHHLKIIRDIMKET